MQQLLPRCVDRVLDPPHIRAVSGEDANRPVRAKHFIDAVRYLDIGYIFASGKAADFREDNAFQIMSSKDGFCHRGSTSMGLAGAQHSRSPVCRAARRYRAIRPRELRSIRTWAPSEPKRTAKSGEHTRRCRQARDPRYQFDRAFDDPKYRLPAKKDPPDQKIERKLVHAGHAESPRPHSGTRICTRATQLLRNPQ
jgi:hypothetical protein